MMNLKTIKTINKNRIWDVFQFLCYTGNELRENKEVQLNDDGTPKLQPKPAMFKIFVQANRGHKNLKIMAKEGVWYDNLFLGPQDSIYIPFSNISSKFGMDIYIIVSIQEDGEDIDKHWKKIVLLDYRSKGGPTKLIDLIRSAIKSRQSYDEELEDLNDIVWLDFQWKQHTHKYKVTYQINGTILIQNWDKNRRVISSDSPMGQKIIKTANKKRTNVNS